MFAINTKRRRSTGKKGILFAVFIFAILVGVFCAFINDSNNYSRITWESESDKTNVSVKADDLALATAAGAYINGLAGEIAESKRSDITMTSADTAASIAEAIEQIKKRK